MAALIAKRASAPTKSLFILFSPAFFFASFFEGA
jgi:hypothetical protein